MSKRASDDLADRLHAMVFESILEEIERYRNHKDPEGKPDPLPVPPALLAQAIKVLKDNGIDSTARAKAAKDRLAGVLPNLEDVEDEHTHRPN